MKRDKRKPGRAKTDLETIRGLAKKSLTAEQVLQALVHDVLYNRGRIRATQDQPGRHSLVYRVDELANAIWGQWMVAVCENQEFQDCDQCKKPIAISLEAPRSNRRFCSNRCQMKAYRQRKKGDPLDTK